MGRGFFFSCHRETINNEIRGFAFGKLASRKKVKEGPVKQASSFYIFKGEGKQSEMMKKEKETGKGKMACAPEGWRASFVWGLFSLSLERVGITAGFR